MIPAMTNFFPQYRIESLYKQDEYFYYHFARHVNGHAVLVQSIRESYQGNSSVVERLRQYANMVNTLQHPVLPSLYDCLVKEDNIFLIWEHIEGLCISDYMHQQANPFSERKAQRMVLSLLHVLNFLLEKGEAPARLDTQMIWITKDEHIKLRGIIDEKMPLGLTYHPAEESLHTPADYVRAVGLVWYHLITAKHPADMGDDYIKKGRLPMPHVLYPGVFEHVENCLFKALHPNAEKRYASLSEFERAIIAARIQARLPVSYSFWQLNMPLIALAAASLLTGLLLFWGVHKEAKVVRVAYMLHDTLKWRNFSALAELMRHQRNRADSLLLVVSGQQQEYLHRLAPDESLADVAARYNMPVEQLKLLNRLDDNELSAVSVLRVRVLAIHRVSTGETPDQILARYGVPAEVFCRANDLDPSILHDPKAWQRLIYPGRELVIPLMQ